MRIFNETPSSFQGGHDSGMTLYLWRYYTVLYKRVTFNVDFQVAAATINKNITILLTGEKLDGS